MALERGTHPYTVGVGHIQSSGEFWVTCMLARVLATNSLVTAPKSGGYRTFPPICCSVSEKLPPNTRRLKIYQLLLQNQQGTEGSQEERMYPTPRLWTARAGCIIGKAGFVLFAAMFVSRQLPALCSYLPHGLAALNLSASIRGSRRRNFLSNTHACTFIFEHRRVLQLLSISSALPDKRLHNNRRPGYETPTPPSSGIRVPRRSRQGGPEVTPTSQPRRPTSPPESLTTAHARGQPKTGYVYVQLPLNMITTACRFTKGSR